MRRSKMQFDMNIGVVMTNEKAILPTKTQGNIGIDLYCVADTEFKKIIIETPSKLRGKPPNKTEIIGYALQPGERKRFSTGIKLQIPAGYAIILKDRSGNAANYGLHVLAGVIDSSYKGELQIVILNTSTSEVIVHEGHKIAQMIVVPDYQFVFTEITPEELVESARGEKGFGSSGR
jgi:dUTP pyrophosphatase